MKFLAVLLASCLALLSLTTATPTTSPTKSKTSAVSSKSSASLPKTTTSSTKSSSASSKVSTSLPKTTTKATATSTKASSTSSKTSSASSKATTYDINFDERVVNPLLAALNPVGVEDTIFFNSWAVNVQPPTVGVPAHSQPNAIVTAFEQQAVNGTPSLTILYPGSPLKSFDLRSFFFGCTANTVATAVDAALQCTIFVAGFRGGQEVAVASYAFTPPTVPLDVPMIQAVLPGEFVKLENVTIIQDDPLVEVLVADNFYVTTHT